MKKQNTTFEDIALESRRRKKAKSFKLFLYVLPCIVLVFLFKYLPLWGWIYSFYDFKPGRDLFACKFIGLDNFKVLFSNAVMRKNLFRVLENTIGIHLLGYIFAPLPMLFAIFLSEIRSNSYKKLVQTITTLPHFISWIIMFSLALGILGSNGMVNTVLKNSGSDKTINILTSDKNVWITQVFLQQWKNLGWDAIVYFAAIAGLDQEIYEAAMVDGAGRGAKIWYITIPQLIPTFFVLLIMSLGNFLNTGIDQYMAFGNALNKNYIEVLDLYVYNLGIGSGQISFSVATGIMKAFVALILFSLANIASKKIRGTSVF